MAALMDLATAKDHLRIRTTDQDADLDLKLNQASAIIVRYLGDAADDGWTAIPQTETPPDNVLAATLYVFEDLFERRPINWDIVRDLLVSYRTSALA